MKEKDREIYFIITKQRGWCPTQVHNLWLSFRPSTPTFRHAHTEKLASVLVTVKMWGTHGLIEMISDELLTCALLGDTEGKGFL